MKIEYNEKEIAAMAELTEHTLANEIEAPKEVLRKEFQKQIYKECKGYKEVIQ